MPQRKPLLDRLLIELHSQIRSEGAKGKIIIDVLEDEGEMTIGAKRNLMMGRVSTEYFCFVDDDDMVDGGYINHLLAVARSGADVGALKGRYFRDGKYVCDLSRSIAHFGFSYKDSEPLVKWMNRPPDHLNVWRTELVRDIPFQDRRRKEDIHWAIAIERIGRIQREHPCERMLYHYLYRSK